MKYIGMPFGMWTLFVPSFRNQLTAVFGYDTDTAKAITKKANPENAEPAQPVQFIGNVNSHKFHAPDCANLPTEKNRIIFGTYEQAIEAGYTPCGSCLG